MGYYVSLEESSAVIPAEKLTEALWRLQRINQSDFDHLKNGGSSTGEKWFSWMPPSFEEFDSAKAILEHCGFECELQDGDLVFTGYDSKTGCEQTFIRQLADLFAPGGYMVWKGEDGDEWKYEFDGEQAIEYSSVRSWVAQSFAKPYITWAEAPVIEEAL